MEAPKLYFYQHGGPVSRNARPRTSADAFDALSFDEQHFLLTEAVHERARHICGGDEGSARRVAQTVHALDAYDFFELKEALKHDQTLKFLLNDAFEKMKILND